MKIYTFPINYQIMKNRKNLSIALQEFKTKYPSITSADLQTFILAWNEAVTNGFVYEIKLKPLDVHKKANELSAGGFITWWNENN